MLKSYKLKKLVSKTQPLMKDLVSPTKAVLYAFSDCIIQYTWMFSRVNYLSLKVVNGLGQILNF